MLTVNLRGRELTVTGQYAPETPDTRYEPGSRACFEIETITEDGEPADVTTKEEEEIEELCLKQIEG